MPASLCVWHPGHPSLGPPSQGRVLLPLSVCPLTTLGASHPQCLPLLFAAQIDAPSSPLPSQHWTERWTLQQRPGGSLVQFIFQTRRRNRELELS